MVRGRYLPAVFSAPFPESRLAQKPASRKVYAPAHDADAACAAALRGGARFYVERHCSFAACVCVPADFRWALRCACGAYGLRLLGLCTDVDTPRFSLGHHAEFSGKAFES